MERTGAMARGMQTKFEMNKIDAGRDVLMKLVRLKIKLT